MHGAKLFLRHAVGFYLSYPLLIRTIFMRVLMAAHCFDFSMRYRDARFI
jgi:hypothetical protein